MAHFDVRESRFASPRPLGARCLSLSFVTSPIGIDASRQRLDVDPLGGSSQNR